VIQTFPSGLHALEVSCVTIRDTTEAVAITSSTTSAPAAIHATRVAVVTPWVTPLSMPLKLPDEVPAGSDVVLIARSRCEVAATRRDGVA
jgi:hypothetical protein